MTELTIGKVVPDFKLESTSDEIIHLKKLRGKNIILYFYPKDNTPGCTNESKDFSDAYKKFQKLNTEIYGISRDTIASHIKFKDKYNFPFELLSDHTEEVCHLYDVIKMKNMFGKKVRGIVRSTFLIDQKGVLRQQWIKVKVPGHVDEVLSAVKNL